MKESLSERIVQAIIVICLIILAFLCIFPVYNSVVLSFNDGVDAISGGIYFWPRKFTLDNYKVIFADDSIFRAFGITGARTVIGTITSIVLTSMFAFSMSKKDLIGGRLYMKMCIITMYFGGGLIPSYLLIRGLGLRDNFLVYIIPGLVSVWNMIIFRSFFMQIPESLEESARIDGCNYLTVFFRIIMPVSKPVYASLGLFTAVGHWNDWFTASIYINNKNLYPIQTLLNQRVNASSAMEELVRKASNIDGFISSYNGITSKAVILSCMVVATAPIILIYPFAQKYFTKGIMLGSVKG
jgi:putative aldouronate transport system permease protein